LPGLVSLKKLCEALVADIGVSPTAVEGANAHFVSNGIRHTLVVVRDARDPGRFGWTVTADDEELGDMLAGFGGFGVEIWRPARKVVGSLGVPREDYSYPRPASIKNIDPTVLADVREYAGAAVAFVQDRHDLGRLLCSAEDVHRAGVWANLTKSTGPARLVKAVILARYSRDEALESTAMEALKRRGDTNIGREPDVPYLFRRAVADWAKEYRARVPVDLSDLVAQRSGGA
jgi:hypothetical protein